MADRSGQVVVVTGASAGVGRAVVRRFAADGARLALLARGRDGLDAARREVEAAGGVALTVPIDVGSWEAVDHAAARIEAELGPIDIWINNAMVSVFSRVRDMEPDDYRRVTDVTYLGVVYGTLAALQRMLPRNRGTIVQVGSALAYRGIPLQSAYCAAKHAMQGFTDSLRTELLHDGSAVRVTTVHLPAVNTPQFEWVKSRLPCKAQPVPPVFQPEIAADAIYHAARRPRREMWIGLSTVAAIFGNRLAPGLLDRYLAATGVASQQTSDPEDPRRAHNLWSPVAGDHGAHGAFDSRARRFSLQAWAAMHRRAAWALALGAPLALALAFRRLPSAAPLSSSRGSAAPPRLHRRPIAPAAR
jgi:NAD(P)-dependent dehydrogenase (short-subunit alcohol dehydrogenase family)